MAQDAFSEHPLFGGAISMTFPDRFQDLSNVRQVPDHQEAFSDPDRDESIIVELLDLKHEVTDETSAVWFLQDLAREQDAEGGMVIEQSGVIEVPTLSYRNTPAVVTTAVGQMLNLSIQLDTVFYVYWTNVWLIKLCLVIIVQAISKGRQGREAQNIVRVYLANLRLKAAGTDVLITAYEPVVINPLSESAGTVGAGAVRPAEQSGCTSMAENFKVSVTSFKVNDWGLFQA
ncbi:hypothetical protein KSS87_023475 [Heliosperma pusillum]|nr:hypothetical protein KSS87_023475 [Heliosperma pusillum]